jgi:DNA-binding NarL/FixJ family response regulator
VHLRCLIVDDNAQFLEAATRVLQRDGVMVAGVASSIEEALAMAGELRPDVYLVDIGLGAESGFDLADRLAADPALRPARVILTSTCAEADFTDLIAASPAIGFLAKSALSGRALQEALAVDGERRLLG